MLHLRGAQLTKACKIENTFIAPHGEVYSYHADCVDFTQISFIHCDMITYYNDLLEFVKHYGIYKLTGLLDGKLLLQCEENIAYTINSSAAVTTQHPKT